MAKKEEKNPITGMTPTQEAKVAKKLAAEFKKRKAELEKNERENVERQRAASEKVIEAVNGLSVGGGITVIGAAVGLIIANADPTNENHTTERAIAKLTSVICSTIVQLSEKKENK